MSSPIIQKTITETFLHRVKTTPTKVGFQFKPTYSEMGPVGQWKELTFKEFYQDCHLISYGLMNLGVKPGDKVAILSYTRIEWSLCDMAILGARGITVPVYASNVAEDVVFICNHSEAKILILEDEHQLRKVLEKRTANPECLPYIQKIIVLEPGGVIAAAKYPSFFKEVISLQALKELGKREYAKDPSRFDRNLAAAQPDDLITICYTSGTTGIPKGVMLTHDNMISVAEDVAKFLFKIGDISEEVILSFLPFSHIFGKMESMLGYCFGWRQAFAQSTEALISNLIEVKPTILLAVPRVFEKIYSKIVVSVDESSPMKKELFYKALSAGKEYYNAIWTQKRPSVRSTLEYQVGKQVILKKLVQRFGGRLKFAVCGGAPLPREIGEFFQFIGIQIYEGYGLTETCAPICVNTPDEVQFGTVGRPLPEVSLKIAEDGEILVKSRKVFKGYYKMPAETKEVLKDGWLYTGDIGFIDSSGYLHITDRKKDLIVTSGGKSVAPQKIENLAVSQKFINQFVVIGDRRPYLTAIVTLNRDQIIQYANEHEILFSVYGELINNSKILALAQKAIDEVNQQLAGYETIKKFIILPREFTIEGGELTPSLKAKRKFISQKYKAELDSLYPPQKRILK